ncbi:polynucleotide 5'-hydroxyl-kinase NOL9 [Topomyia yanbarensis]|uniref:polynucleotide 5'-hydroxyl-kinase NOL9 n=1 Tax=Topomyia yanbarensis TaxID=2498891 RepID=UPI00273B56AC|nr:polynucleotide 5'-hydroxyl-kinase NOL9 [Topomyia yanbarensis]XP_058832501.1 polynucleotide 5'-hydroxyl-kinase NOL9 [Topomyia yanbarensis]
MNKSRREFSSRSKSFNSNANKKTQKHAKSWDNKKAQPFPASSMSPGLGKKKNAYKDEHISNGFERQNKSKIVTIPAPKPVPKKVSSVIVENGKASVKATSNEKFKAKNENSSNSYAKVNSNHSKNSNSEKATAKRKNERDVVGVKKRKLPKSESDSDAEDYIDKFFQDVVMGAEDVQDESSSSEEDLTSESDSNSSKDSEEDDGLPFEKLLEYYGSYQDKKQRDISKRIPQKVGKVKSHAAKGCSKSSSHNGWIEEDNDVGLIYHDSDDDRDDTCKALVPVDDSLETSEDDVDFLPDEFGEEEGDDISDEEDVLSELEDDSLDEEFSSGEDSSSMGDDYFVSDSEDYDSEEDEELSILDEEEDESYWDDSYDSEDDEDYEPSEEDDDLFIGRGSARIYEIDDNNVSFNSDIDSAQIVEIPSDDGRKYSVPTSASESQSDDDEIELCPELVPIYDTHGRLIDNAGMLERKHKKREKSPKASNECKPVAVRSPQASKQLEQMECDDASQSSHKEYCSQSSSPRIGDTASTESCPIGDEFTVPTNYRFYDSIDMRMSLALLKDTIFFSGSLTVQPLIGGLEVMGYYLKQGEIRSAFAARGFHSLNLSPHPAGMDFSKQSMAEVLQRLEKHFLDADLKDAAKNFNPAESVLVLLQSDCNNQRIEVVGKYLPEEVIFPKVELLKKSQFFTTEYLLNAEFYSEHVDKSTALFKSDPQWDNIVVRQNSKIVVMGGKGAGKSTLCQYLINKSVATFKKVVLIDLDIGQPIQHVPETISVTIVNRPLLGLTTFDPITPAKCWLFGSLDVVSSPIFYIQNVRRLVQYCHQHKTELANIPWIVNTMGYVTGFGEELMAAILRMLSPTDVVQLVCTNKSLPIPNFQNTLSSDFLNQYNFNILQSEVQEFCQRKLNFRHHEVNVCYSRKGFTLNAPKRRSVMLLSHLANILNDSSSEWFNEVKPFCAPLGKLQILITREDQTVTEEQLPSVLNATLVYLCRKTDVNLYECLGIGIVRGVDKNNNVYLLQSLPPEELAEVTVLAICSSSLPNAIFLRQSARVQGSIPYVYNVR